MSSYYLYLIFDHFRAILSISVFIWLLNRYFQNNPGCKISVIFRFLPKYKKLVSQHNVKYPCVMEIIDKTDCFFDNIKEIINLKSYIYINDKSFVIISTVNPDIYIEIPFESIIYHNSFFDSIDSVKTYDYCFELYFKYNNNHIQRLFFTTLEYNHKLCKKFPDLLCDDQLFNFVCENFIDKEEYQRRRDLERRRAHDNFFETSIFHKFTTIDAE